MFTSLLSKLTTKVVVWVVIGACAVALATVAWRHYSGLISDKAELSQRIGKLESALEVARLETQVAQAQTDFVQTYLDKWVAASAVQTKALLEYMETQDNASVYLEGIKNVLEQHDLEALAKAKPGLIRKRLNLGTDRLFRMLEQASKAPGSDAGKDPAGAASPTSTPSPTIEPTAGHLGNNPNYRANLL